MPSRATAAIGLVWLMLAAGPAGAQKAEQVVPDPSACSSQHDAVPAKGGGYVCRSKLKTQGDIFEKEKNPEDPCPEGTWWSPTRDPCSPIVCLRKKNLGSFKNFCPRAHHTHINSGADWEHPIVCVEDFLPENAKNGGAPLRPGGCQVCVFETPDHRNPKGPDWTFRLPVPDDVRRRAKERIEKTEDWRVQPSGIRPSKTAKGLPGFPKAPRSSGTGRKVPAAWGDFTLPHGWGAQSTGLSPSYHAPDNQHIYWHAENPCHEPVSREQFFERIKDWQWPGWPKHGRTWIGKDGPAPAVYKISALSGHYDGGGYAYCGGVMQKFFFSTRKIKTLEAMLSSLRCQTCRGPEASAYGVPLSSGAADAPPAPPPSASAAARGGPAAADTVDLSDLDVSGINARSEDTVRRSIRREALLRDVDSSLRQAMAEELSSIPTGKDLLRSLGGKLPMFYLGDIGRAGLSAVYKDPLNLFYFDCRSLRHLPGAPASGCADAQRWMLEQPERVHMFAWYTLPVFAHEVVHMLQRRRFGPGEELPNDGLYHEGEVEAKSTEMLCVLEAAERDSTVLSSRLPLWYGNAEELFVASWDPEDYFASVEKVYAGLHPGNATISLSEALRRTSPEAGASPTRDRLERMKAYYDRVLGTGLMDQWRVLSRRSLPLFSRKARKPCPAAARAILGHAMDLCAPRKEGAGAAPGRDCAGLSALHDEAVQEASARRFSGTPDPVCPGDGSSCGFEVRAFHDACLKPGILDLPAQRRAVDGPWSAEHLRPGP